ncbi:type III secretion protein HrpB4 [Paraburkholderia bonniea]|uniref:type III secretion protein HrpB4 n=1 Tax=Paraburkholderia bonniea TaxID=2152891 RepID=UPI0012913031|nr:type III secretion protein HrpB4 [Paraburkholderia bonniea]WJF89342.1 type III secretion protein HrpB4 [Paraburkholderia bonniea]WJF92658.1 type III secretion protein HrpB4 [Paraburkholderia bonniea]
MKLATGAAQASMASCERVGFAVELSVELASGLSAELPSESGVADGVLGVGAEFSAAVWLLWLRAYEARVRAVSQQMIARQCEAWGQVAEAFLAGKADALPGMVEEARGMVNGMAHATAHAKAHAVPAATAPMLRHWPQMCAAWLSPLVPPGALLPQANRLALLEPQWLLRVLAARTLFAMGGALRLIVAREQRRLLSAAVGEHALIQLMQCNAKVLPRSLSQLQAQVQPDISAWLAVSTSLTLAASGWSLLQCDQACPLPLAETLVTLTLRGCGMALTPDASPTTSPTINAFSGSDSERFLVLLPRLFPELQWLSG